MDKINDGGPAFPCEQHETHDRGWNQTFEPGMTLRDWFAGQALAGFMACGYEQLPFGSEPADIAARAYEHADAMLAQRAKAGK